MVSGPAALIGEHRLPAPRLPEQTVGARAEEPRSVVRNIAPILPKRGYFAGFSRFRLLPPGVRK
jgi:hypothetical protein